jgi:hypothetical protein
MIEVPVAGVEPQVVLQDERGDPEVVRRNRGSLHLELAKDRGIALRGAVIRVEHADAVFHEEAPEDAFVVCHPASHPETGSKLR